MAPFKANGVDIIDIRREKLDDTLLEMLLKGLSPEEGLAKSLPTLLLYDERGLKLFEHITYLDEYYPTNSEIEVLEHNAEAIAHRLQDGCRLLELGSGNLRKVEILLKAFEKNRKSVNYFALDLSISELSRTFTNVPTNDYKYVKFYGLHGTYDDGLTWLAEQEHKPTAILTLGSSIGNFSRTAAAKFLKSFGDRLKPGDSILVGLDACRVPEKVYKAYNDAKGLTEWFYRNGLDHANILLGYQAFRQDDWTVEGHYDESDNKHEACYIAKKDVQIGNISIAKGEKVNLEEAFKYSDVESDELWHAAGLVRQVSYANHDKSYGLHLLTPAGVSFTTDPLKYARSPVPSFENWQQLWTTWDVVTKSMVPRGELLNKPIKLRNNLIFYLGHIPAFADIHMTKATGSKPTDPACYQTMFERGIDPDVDNPENCHAHSEIPDTWPPLSEISEYQRRVRDRVDELTRSGEVSSNLKLARGLWLAYEHEAMHLETFLYMLLQSERVLAPPGVQKPDFATLAAKGRAGRAPNEWHRIPESDVVIGLDDPETDLGPERYFGWDNERPSRSVRVGDFEAKSRPISNGEYAYFLEVTKQKSMPASWTIQAAHVNGGHASGVAKDIRNGHSNGLTNSELSEVSKAFLRGKAIRTVFGQVPLEHALEWPVMASYDELAAFAEWADGRIPTFEEARSMYNYAEAEKAELEKMSSKLISAVNGHLCNEGVQETPPSDTSSKYHGADIAAKEVNGVKHSKLDPRNLFIDLSSSNTGFATWNPVPVTHKSTLCGQSDLGGLWEWTSSPLAEFPGFKPMDLYPAYTADFFDGKHNICLGGSWATIPRIAGRKSFVNWYQRNYPYVWCTARLVRDIKST